MKRAFSSLSRFVMIFFGSISMELWMGRLKCAKFCHEICTTSSGYRKNIHRTMISLADININPNHSRRESLEYKAARLCR